jgi:hypothetical protein
MSQDQSVDIERTKLFIRRPVPQMIVKAVCQNIADKDEI